MHFIDIYPSSIGNIAIETEDDALIALSFENRIATAEDAPKIIKDTRTWLDIYFSGKEPSFFPKIRLTGSPFQIAIHKLLLQIPYGETTTYGEIARKASRMLKRDFISPQAAGGAIGRNRIAIIIPCHRVIGANNNLTGYAWGVEKKKKLLEIEHIDTSSLSMPKEK